MPAWPKLFANRNRGGHRSTSCYFNFGEFSLRLRRFLGLGEQMLGSNRVSARMLTNIGRRPVLALSEWRVTRTEHPKLQTENSGKRYATYPANLCPFRCGGAASRSRPRRTIFAPGLAVQALSQEV